MNIRISREFKTINVDFFASINFDWLDMQSNMIFIWKNDEIVGNIVFPFEYDYTIEIDEKKFNSYLDFKTYTYKNDKNLFV